MKTNALKRKPQVPRSQKQLGFSIFKKGSLKRFSKFYLAYNRFFFRKVYG